MPRPALSYGLLALAAVAATTGFVAHRVLDRPGMTALSMVPANANAVFAIDLVPAPDQILAFKSIDEMVSRTPGAHPDGTMIGTILDGVLKGDKLEPLAQQIDRSVAFALLPKPGKPAEDGEGVMLIPVKDAGAVAAFLRKVGKPESVGGASLTMVKTAHQGDVHFSLQGSVLVASPQAWAAAAVVGVAEGRAPSIEGVSGFMASRAKALPSANLLVLASPALSRGNEWLVGSMTIHDTGLEFAVDGRTDDKDVLKAGSLKPLGQGLLDALPRGAYGFFATAQPGPAVALAGEKLDDPAKEMRKEMDLDLRDDVLPALGGNVAVAFYPSFGPDAGLDLLVSVDDANGADPASLARKLEKSLGEQIEKGGDKKGPWMVSMPVEGAEASVLADEPRQEMQKELLGMEKSFARPLTLSRGKTVAWATVGKSVILATSQELLNRAIFARRNPSASVGLSGDASLGSNPSVAADGQFALAISMKKLAEGIRNTVDPSHMSPETAKMFRQALSLYDNTTEPFALRARMDPDGHYHGYFSVPIDWTKLPTMMK